MAINSGPLVPIQDTPANGQLAGAVSPPKRNPGRLITPHARPQAASPATATADSPSNTGPNQTDFRPPGPPHLPTTTDAAPKWVDMSAAAETRA